MAACGGGQAPPPSDPPPSQGGATSTASVGATEPAASSPAAAQTFSVSLTWTAPTSSADDSALDDLAGYRIYVSATPGQYGSAAMEVAATTPGAAVQATVGGLAPGAHYFVVTAFDTSGNESARSPELRKTAP